MNPIICAAIIAESGKIFRGHRHSHAIAAAKEENEKFISSKRDNQGFILVNGMYITRQQAYTIHKMLINKSANKDGYVDPVGEELYSEDLY